MKQQQWNLLEELSTKTLRWLLCVNEKRNGFLSREDEMESLRMIQKRKEKDTSSR